MKPQTNQALWDKVCLFPLDDPSSSYSFTERLARENDWTVSFAIRVVQEYKKFMFMLAIGEGPLAPSDEVDQAWHLHLLYTRSYWEEFCPLLGCTIHHGPTKGGKAEKEKHDDLYARSKAAYRKVFGEETPEDIWPPHEIRFGEIYFTRVNRHRNWILPKPTWLRALFKKK